MNLLTKAAAGRSIVRPEAKLLTKVKTIRTTISTPQNVMGVNQTCH
jgi:hypothetical protein